MISYQDADAALAQMLDDPLDVQHRDRIDAGEGLVEQHEARLCGEGPGDLDAPPFSAREADTRAVPDMRDMELLQQFVELHLAVRSPEILACLEDGEDVVLDAQVPEHRRFLRQIAQPHPRPAVHG
jgi:hypothetical protein